MFTDSEVKMMAFIAEQTKQMKELQSQVENLLADQRTMQNEISILHGSVPHPDMYVTREDHDTDLASVERKVDDLDEELHGKLDKEDLRDELSDYVKETELEQEVEDKVKEILSEAKISIDI